MAQLLLQRIKEYQNVKTPKSNKIEDSTISTLLLVDDNGEVRFEGFACENAGESTDKSGTDKRIVAREYYLQWCVSSKNGSLARKFPKWSSKNGKSIVIWVKNDEVPNFNNRLIRIHTGNGPANTEGCILPGLSESGTGLVGNSVLACNKLFTEIEKIGIENITLIVTEI